MDVSLQAVNKQGRTIDFYLSSTRNIQAAKRFLGKALKSWTPPGAINTDKALKCYHYRNQAPAASSGVLTALLRSYNPLAFSQPSPQGAGN
jgi:transposase-like protein